MGRLYYHDDCDPISAEVAEMFDRWDIEASGEDGDWGEAALPVQRVAARLRDLLASTTRHYRARTDRSHRNLREWAEDDAFPAATIVAANADVFAAAGGTGKATHTLKQNTVISEVATKKEVDGRWWYEVRFDGGAGWVRSSEVAELADPATFTFSSVGGTGSGSPFAKLRKAVSSAKVEPSIARHINYLNAVLLPHLDWSLSDFAAGAFYHALVEAKGNFKKAALIETATYRAHKPSSTDKNVYPWVQRGDPKAAFKISEYRDKLWHFYWNAYLTFDGDGAAFTKGLVYELKSRPDPLTSFLTLTPLDDDATADVVFNKGGINFAKWIDGNRDAVLEHMALEIGKQMRDEIRQDPELSREIPADRVDEVVIEAMKDKAVQTELKKRAYQIFADYAGAHVLAVLKALAKGK